VAVALLLAVAWHMIVLGMPKTLLDARESTVTITMANSRTSIATAMKQQISRS